MQYSYILNHFSYRNNLQLYNVDLLEELNKGICSFPSLIDTRFHKPRKGNTNEDVFVKNVLLARFDKVVQLSKWNFCWNTDWKPAISLPLVIPRRSRKVQKRYCSLTYWETPSTFPSVRWSFFRGWCKSYLCFQEIRQANARKLLPNSFHNNRLFVDLNSWNNWQDKCFLYEHIHCFFKLEIVQKSVGRTLRTEWTNTNTLAMY